MGEDIRAASDTDPPTGQERASEAGTGLFVVGQEEDAAIALSLPEMETAFSESIITDESRLRAGNLLLCSNIGVDVGT